ncbi:Phosphotransferase system EIIA 2 domain-containing protein [Desulfonema limicola]|uniref:Phosphotransferase system EIIA 2 domain-containing protein n=1 Tax=Desulfonema limicola TaxID=45656 RepID=A0A975BA05_9BACT|nr:PTS sugar transporter subunit IIA [Desulfonema limicola]QTA81392.1 Phosphotransferase system EIIA 2 domain-containing protein [Desulfonema limicola]
MKIWKYLKQNHIFLDTMLTDKDAVFRFVAETCENEDIVTKASVLYDAMIARENTMSTGIGKGIGLPHAVTWDTEDPAVLFIRPAIPMDFDALDSQPVDLILAMIIPGNRINLHLQILAGISRLCKNNTFLKMLRTAQDSRELWHDIQELEEKMAFH